MSGSWAWVRSSGHGLVSMNASNYKLGPPSRFVSSSYTAHPSHTSSTLDAIHPVMISMGPPTMWILEYRHFSLQNCESQQINYTYKLPSLLYSITGTENGLRQTLDVKESGYYCDFT
jgi:hypothetical protein